MASVALSDFQLVNLLIALAGAVFGLAALAWQAYSWSRSGHRVKVSADWIRSFDPDVVALIVTARNVGRLTAVIDSVGLARRGHDDGPWYGLVLAGIPRPPDARPAESWEPLPCRLEPSHKAVWAIDDWSWIQDYRANVVLATGQRVAGKRLRPPPPNISPEKRRQILSAFDDLQEG